MQEAVESNSDNEWQIVLGQCMAESVGMAWACLDAWLQIIKDAL